MGILNSIKGAAASLAAAVGFGTKQTHPLPEPEAPDDCIVATATPPVPDTSRYRHVSVPLIPIENPLLRKLLGVGYTMGRSQTHNIGNNAMKREADRIAEFHGLNNKQRRRLRTKIKRRAEELRNGTAVLSPGVREGMRRVAQEVMA
jgi:hypothetical protein